MTTSIQSPHRSETTIKAYAESLGGKYFGNWSQWDLLASYDAIDLPDGHLICQCTTSDKRTHFYSVPELRPSRGSYGGKTIPNVRYTGEK